MSSYQVIARKWRPSLFEEIVGQAHVTRTLRNAVSSGRIAHAYLFSGPRGVGKTTAARILAKSLNCVEGPTPAPCNSCESCRGITAGSSVDVFEVDGASNNGVENVRELTDSVRYVPAQGKYKVYIIDEVHMLSTPAFNALLKTLEEPPPHAVFIFATTEVHKIPATILSRCQRFDFKRIPFRDIQQHLKKIVTKEGVKFEDKALFTLAREADGSLRDSQSLLEQALAFAGGELKDSDVSEALGLMDRSILHELSEAMIGKDAKACLNIVEKIYDFGYDLKRGCSDLLEHIRDLTVLKITGDQSLLDLPDSELERLKTASERVGAERLHMLFNVVSKGYEEVSRSAHPRYALEMTLLKAAHFDELKPISELISSLEGLKSRIDTGAEARQAKAPAQVPPARAEFRPPQQASSTNKAMEEVARYEPAVQPAAQSVEKAPVAVAAQGEAGEFLEYVRRRNENLFEIVKDAALGVEGDTLNISVSPRLGTKLTINRQALETVCRDFFKRPLSISINGGGAATEKKKDADPLIMDAVKIFGGRIIEDRRSNV